MLRTFSVLTDAELLTPAMSPDRYFIRRNVRSERKVSSDEGSKTFLNLFATRIQFLLDVRTQFQCNSRTSLMGSQLQLALRRDGQDVRAIQNAPSPEVYGLKDPCPGLARRSPDKRGVAWLCSVQTG